MIDRYKIQIACGTTTKDEKGERVKWGDFLGEVPSKELLEEAAGILEVKHGCHMFRVSDWLYELAGRMP